MEIVCLKFQHIVFQLQLVCQLHVFALALGIVLLKGRELQIFYLLIEVANLIVQLNGEDRWMVLQIWSHLDSIAIGRLARFNSKLRTDNRYVVVELLKLHWENGRLIVRCRPIIMLVQRVNRRRYGASWVILLLILVDYLVGLVDLVVPMVYIRSIIANSVRFGVFVVSRGMITHLRNISEWVFNALVFTELVLLIHVSIHILLWCVFVLRWFRLLQSDHRGVLVFQAIRALNRRGATSACIWRGVHV